MIPEEQIERFFNKQCTAAEAKQVADWLTTHPELISKYLDESEWQQSSNEESLSEEAYNKVWHQLNRKIKQKNTLVKLKWYATAACVIGLIACCIFYFKKNNPVPAIATIHTTVTPIQVLADTVYNATNKIRRVQLRDGSVISLQPKSVVWFDTPFATNKREVYLKGDAGFEIAKNKQKPFTVYAGTFSTTALGTEFIVKQQNNKFKVLLLHGKVVIKAIDNAVKNWKDVYLLPGEQMTYNREGELPVIEQIQDKKKNTATQITKNAAQAETEENLIFNSSPITIVLQKLSDYYHVSIQFSEPDLKDISFTGVIAKRDSVQTILKVIAQMNGLSLENKDNSFIVSKTAANNTNP